MAEAHHVSPIGDRRSRRVPNIVKMCYSIAYGMPTTPPRDPPFYTSDPWWQLTTYDVVRKMTRYTPRRLYQCIWRSFGYPNQMRFAFTMRLLTVRIWGLQGQTITLSITDSQNVVRVLTDSGTETNYSRLGWHFGDIMSSRVHTASEINTLFTVSSERDLGKILVYIQVMIKVPNAKPIKALAQS